MPKTEAVTRKPADQEIAAISKIGKLVEGLEGAARARVLSYLHQRYCPQTPQPSGN